MKMSNLSEHELLSINGGSGIKETYDDLHDVYEDLKNHGYDSAKDFAKGFLDGITSVEFH